MPQPWVNDISNPPYFIQPAEMLSVLFLFDCVWNEMMWFRLSRFIILIVDESWQKMYKNR